VVAAEEAGPYELATIMTAPMATEITQPEIDKIMRACLILLPGTFVSVM
jgi:hypothetical protein